RWGIDKALLPPILYNIAMKTIEELITELKLNPEQSQIVKNYFEDLVIELLESLKEDNLQNFEETISSIRQS
ncbi:MAG: hypothetical protein PHR98_04060, partial [Candidatus Shapirobacteria bacterium]|nr:hypothetical protein [Candidatus Shapirobacteria bacterium]